MIEVGSTFANLLAHAERAHKDVRALQEFCDFPTDLRTEMMSSRHIPSSDLMANDPDIVASADPFVRAIVDARQDAFWRLTYQGTHISQDFLDRFGCYCLIGAGGGYKSAQMSAYFVYMPPNLAYPAHQHPAEELYYILAGKAEFTRAGSTPEILEAGQSVVHSSNQAHATTTYEHGMLAYVLWRNNLDVPPVWSPEGGLT